MTNNQLLKGYGYKMKELVNIIHDDHKRRRFVEKLLRDALSNEGLIVEPLLAFRIDFLDVNIYYTYDPFTFKQEDLDKLVKQEVATYKEQVRIGNKAAFGKEQISPRDVFGDEYVHWQHLANEPEKSDEYSNDNSDACILP